MLDSPIQQAQGWVLGVGRMHALCPYSLAPCKLEEEAIWGVVTLHLQFLLIGYPIGDSDVGVSSLFPGHSIISQESSGRFHAGALGPPG